jgi:hypothetical protein
MIHKKAEYSGSIEYILSSMENDSLEKLQGKQRIQSQRQELHVAENRES